MIPILKMQIRTYFKNPAWVFTIIFPLILMTVLGSVATSTAANGSNSLITPEYIMLILMGNIIVINVVAIMTNGFGSNFMELKDSSIIKRIGASEVSKAETMIGFMLWTILLCGFQIVYTMFLTWFFTNGIGWLAGDLDWGSIDWIGFVYGIIMLIVVSFAMSFMFISISKTNEIYTLIAFTYFMLTMYFGGLIFPGADVKWMNSVSLLLPHTYVAHFFSGAMNGGEYVNQYVNGGVPISIWNVQNWTDEYVLHGVSSLNMFMPWIFSGLAGFTAIKNFKWD